MKLKNFLTCLIFLLASIFNSQSDLEEYGKLKIENVPSIKREDLPDEFGDGAYETVDEFVKKTRNLEYEIVLYFNYTTGEILKCIKGTFDNVKIVFDEGEFEGFNVASIHNHPNELLFPPSSKNFGIFNRLFEDYELVAGFNSFWILKAKGVHKTLVHDANLSSIKISLTSLEFCVSRYGDDEIIAKMHDIRYGNELLKYITDKNLKDIQLAKKEYVTMENNLNCAEYNCMGRATHEEIELARKRVADPNILTGKDGLYAYYQSRGYDVDYDEIFAG